MKYIKYFLFVFILFSSCEKDDNINLPISIKRLEITNEEYNQDDYYQFSYTNRKLSHVTEFLSNVPFNSSYTIQYELYYDDEGRMKQYTAICSNPDVGIGSYTAYLEYRSNQILHYIDNRDILERDTTYYKLLNNKIIEYEYFQNYRMMPGDDGIEFILRKKCQYYYEDNNLTKAEELLIDADGNVSLPQITILSYGEFNNPFYYSPDISIFFINAFKYIKHYFTPLSGNNCTKCFGRFVYKYNKNGYPIELKHLFRMNENDSTTTFFSFYY